MDLEKLRQEIDQIDQQIVSLLAQRLEVVDKIGQVKLEQGLSTLDKARFERLLKKLKSQATQLGASEDLIEKIYHQIHQAAIARQQNLRVK